MQYFTFIRFNYCCQIHTHKKGTVKNELLIFHSLFTICHPIFLKQPSSATIKMQTNTTVYCASLRVRYSSARVRYM